MSFIQNLYTSRDNNTDGNTYVGQVGRLWYNPNTNSIYVSDGNTAGGVPVALATGADIVASDVALNSITSRTGTITITGDIVLNGSANIAGNISPATSSKVGGIKAGPGVDIANDGTLTVDTANLPLSFGNFTASNNELTIVNVGENMVLSTKGSAEIQLVGNIGFYSSGNVPPNVSDRYFYASNDGTVHSKYLDIKSFGETTLAAPFNVSIDPTGNYRAPTVLFDVIAQFTGITNSKSFVLQDNYGYSITPNREGTGGQYVFRTSRGTVDAPQAVQANDFLGDVVAAGWANNGYGGQPSGFYRIVADENFTSTARGGRLEMWVVPNGTITETKIATVSSNGLAVIGTVSATGNIVGSNLISSANVSATTISAVGNITSGNLITAGRVTATGNISTNNYFFGNAAFVTGINAFGNMYANGVAVLATSGSSSLTLNTGNNIVITGDNGTKTVAIAVKDAPTFTGNVTGNYFVGNGAALTSITGANVTGTVNTATNLSAASGILAGAISVNPASVAAGVSAVQTFTLTGLTTNHKLVITSGTALVSGIIITAAWASATDTISVEFRNTANQPVDLGPITIQYFAWV